MKKKFLIFTLCFTLIFTSINYKKSYADGGVISLPILATVSSLAVATGIALNNNDDIYDLGRMFYDYINTNNKMTWETLKATFNSSVVVLNNGLVSVDTPFLDIVKSFFDDTFNNDINGDIVSLGNIFLNKKYVASQTYMKNGGTYSFSFIPNASFGSTGTLELSRDSSGYLHVELFIDDVLKQSFNTVKFYLDNDITFYLYNNINGYGIYADNTYKSSSTFFNMSYFSSIYTFPNSSFDWDNIDSRKENGSVSLPIPGNLGDLVGQPSDTFWDNTDNLVGTGGIVIPGVDNPSINYDDTITFPNVGDSDIPDVDVPGENIWSNVTDYIIGLVVPNDTYWTDTFGGLYNNFTNSFPMVDMDNFNNLVTGEKKFPNIDVNIMGVKGRIVNGDVVNSIVDWLRPIIAGFMMLCLMLFNYRKIYKTIRGVEPFQGIAQGTSDFRTGISEYNYMGTGLSKSDYEANQMELAKALYDYEQDTGKTYKVKI